MLRSLIRPKIFMPRSLTANLRQFSGVPNKESTINEFFHEKIICDSEFNFALQQACKNNNVESVRFLINDSHFDSRINGKYVIEWALIYDHIDIVKIINQRDIANCKQSRFPPAFLLLILLLTILCVDNDDDKDNNNKDD